MMPIETPRQFTDEQAQAMYAALQSIVLYETTIPNPEPMQAYVAYMIIQQTVRNTLQAIATPASENASADGARFVAQWTIGNLYAVWDNTDECFVTQGYATEAEAQAAADALNAGTQGTGE